MANEGKTAVVFEVREFCLHDGPGIRTTVFFKGCPLRCTWCHNPEGLSPEPEWLFKAQKCVHCGSCARGGDCPQGARQLCGRRWSVPALAAELLRNADVFASSGGITFSGGEPLLQAPFLSALIDELRSHQLAHSQTAAPAPLHLAIETSGYAPAEAYRSVVSKLDLVFQDLKHPDPAEHKRWTGVNPAPILANLAWLKASSKPFIARIPLIPGVNDTPVAKAGFADLLAGPSGLLRVELLPYHLTAAAKYPFTGRTYDPGFDENRPLDTDLSPFTDRGLPAVVM
ncbi:MAG: radical SAM protein [Kiritimatiellae bacterium]|nr:radical SAM protein [Kiritimatiellia bacterium]